jgi:hypothetical protein
MNHEEYIFGVTLHMPCLLTCMNANLLTCKQIYKHASLQACLLSCTYNAWHLGGGTRIEYVGKLGAILKNGFRVCSIGAMWGPYDEEKTRAENLMIQSLFQNQLCVSCICYTFERLQDLLRLMG